MKAEESENLVIKNFYPGDEWVYYKLYAGFRTCDTLLSKLIKPLTDKLIKESLINKWFFIRYSDPENHLRLRLQSMDINKYGEIVRLIREMSEPYLNYQQIWRIQTDTYIREIDRYGEKSIALVESCFWYDSEMVIDVIRTDQTDPHKDRTWLFALIAIDQLLKDFHFNEKEKISLIDKLRRSFEEEFNMDRRLKVQLDNKYRLQREKICNVIENIEKSELPGEEYIKFLFIRSEKLSGIVNKILDLEKNNILDVDLNSVISSLIHMMVNRLFRSRQRFHELIIYNFLSRYYKSKIAREKYSTSI